jgi:DNA-binding transcriptional ArsR family regulator
MKSLKRISDPEAFKLFADGTRRKIVFLLRVKEMTVSQIAEEIDITPQTVYHHIRKLIEGGMVEVAREVRVDHLIESYYRSTAEAFEFTVGRSSHGEKARKEQVEGALMALKKIGFKIQYDEKTVSQIAKLQMDMAEFLNTEKNEEALAKLDDVDPLTRMEAQEYASILSASDEELAKRDVIRNKLWDLIRSLVKK